MSKSLHTTAVAATLHCLTGCAIGEITGMVIGEIFGLSSFITIALSISLAFLFGYTLSALPLVRGGASFRVAIQTVFAADTVSILTMEIVDNLIMYLIPGAMGAGLVNPLFWVSMASALFVAFWAAYPVNRYMISRGKGHAIIHAQHEVPVEHQHHEHRHGYHEHQTQTTSHEHTMDNKPLTYAIIAFLAGGLLVSLAATSFDRTELNSLEQQSSKHRSHQ